MKISSICRILCALFLVALCPGVHAQRDNSIASRLLDLKSDNLQTRMEAYDKIRGSSELLKRSDVRLALVDLLDRENRLIQVTNSVPGQSVDEKYGEGYAEYVSFLLETVETIADWHDPRYLCVMAHGLYGPGADIASKLAEEGGAAIVPCLLKMARGDDDDRERSISILVQLANVNKSLGREIDPQIQGAILAGLHDSDAQVRRMTIRAIGKFGKPEMVPILENIAQNDPQSRLINGKRQYDVREEAIKAIRSIQERAKTQ